MGMAIGAKAVIMWRPMNKPIESRRYRWPWLVAAAVLLAMVLAVIWVGLAAKNVQRERDLNAPLPSSAPVH